MHFVLSAETDSVKYRFSCCKTNCQLLTIYFHIMWQALIIKITFHILFIVCHNMLLKQLQWTVSSHDWTNTGMIWTSKAAELPSPLTIKYKFKFKFKFSYSHTFYCLHCVALHVYTWRPMWLLLYILAVGFSRSRCGLHTFGRQDVWATDFWMTISAHELDV